MVKYQDVERSPAHMGRTRKVKQIKVSYGFLTLYSKDDFWVFLGPFAAISSPIQPQIIQWGKTASTEEFV